MKLLAWDTSSASGTVVALEWDPNTCQQWSDVRLIAEFSFNMQAQVSERLLWGIHQVLESASWNIQDIDLFGIGVGPGSFTGLRIGITTVRTFASLFKKPILKISSLAALARPLAMHLSASEKETSHPFVSWLMVSRNAYQGEIFVLWGLSQHILHCVQPRLWHAEVTEEVIAAPLFIQTIQKKLKLSPQNSVWTVAGSYSQKSDIWNALPQEKQVWSPFTHLEHVQGRYLGQLAWEASQAHVFDSDQSVFPNYLRASYAENKKQKD